MNKQQILQLISHSVTPTFHLRFEKHLKLRPDIREAFGSDELLSQIRRVYLYEYLARLSTSRSEQINYYKKGLSILETLSPEIEGTLSHLLFISHYIAKLNYQLGTLWMKVNSSLDEQAIQHAKNYFATALTSYKPFEIKIGVEANLKFCDISYQLHEDFKHFDAYSPWARVISCSYNHYCCCEEDITCELSLDDLLLDLEGKIDLSKDCVGSISYAAIQEVREKIQQIRISSLVPQDRLETRVEPTIDDELSLPAKKRKKLNKISIPNVFEIKWKPSILSLIDFSNSLQQKSWSVPAFLRERQQKDLDAIYDGFQRCRKPLLVTKPTGTGKTAEFTALTSSAYVNGLCTIIVVPTITLVMQTRQKFIEYKERSAEMNYELEDISIYSPTENQRETGPITIITMASFINQTKQALNKFPNKEMLRNYLDQHPEACFKSEVLFHPDFFSLLIIDEGHHVDGKQFYTILSREQCVRPKVLFSASTMPGDYPKIDKICEPVVTQTLKEAILSGELSPLQMLTLDFSMYPEAKELTRSIRSRMKKNDNVNIEEDVGNLLCNNIGFSYTAAGIIQQIYDKVPGAQKLMVFTDSIDHANLLAKILTIFFKKKVDAFHTQADNREYILEHFKSIPKSIIVAVGALDEGFDDPDVNLILDFSLYRQRTRRLIQRIGRAERIRENGSSAIILNIKVLANDLQLTPRDVIMGTNQSHSYLGLNEDEIIDEHLIKLVLPPPLSIEHEIQGINICREIKPQGARIIFPKNNIKHKIGSPPVDTEQTYASTFFHHSSSFPEVFVNHSSTNQSHNEKEQEEWLDFLSTLI